MFDNSNFGPRCQCVGVRLGATTRISWRRKDYENTRDVDRSAAPDGSTICRLSIGLLGIGIAFVSWPMAYGYYDFVIRMAGVDVDKDLAPCA